MSDDFKKLMNARFLFTLSVQMQAVIIGWQIYRLTRIKVDPLPLKRDSKPFRIREELFSGVAFVFRHPVLLPVYGALCASGAGVFHQKFCHRFENARRNFGRSINYNQNMHFGRSLSRGMSEPE